MSSLTVIDHTVQNPAQSYISKDLKDKEVESNIQTLADETKRLLVIQDVRVPTHCEQFIFRCLRVKNYDVTKAAALVKNFGLMIRLAELKELFSQFKPTLLKDLYCGGNILPLLRRDPHGRLIIVCSTSGCDPAKFNFDQAFAAIIMLFDFSIASSTLLQKVGTVFVLDFSGWNFQDLKELRSAISTKRLSRLAKIFQNSNPGKIKAIHIVHYPNVVKLIYMMVKPFLKSKLKQRVHFHEDGESSLETYFGFKVLIETLDGVLDEKYVDDKLLQQLMKQDQYYQDMIKFKYPTS